MEEHRLMRAINHFQILWAWGLQVCRAGSVRCQFWRKNTLETGHTPVLEAAKPVGRDCLPSVKNICCLRLGAHEVPAWYAASS